MVDRLYVSPRKDMTSADTTAFPPSAAYPTALADAHLVTRPDLIRVDDGGISEKATLIVDGKIYEDWTSVWIQWAWAAPFATFRFTCAEREPYPLPGAVLQFAPGAQVDIYLGGIQVIKGTIITRQVAYDANQHMVQLQGVSYSWYANRSGIEHETSDFSNKTFLQIASEILAPTGVGFTTVGAINEQPFADATPQKGQTIGQFLEQLARERKIIISNLPDGRFLFVGEHSLQTEGELIEGVNIKKMQCVISTGNAYSEFIVHGSTRASDDQYGRQASEQEARVAGILPAYSILMTAVEHPVWTPGELMLRAQTEKMWNENMTVIEAAVTVYGWFRPLPTSIATAGVPATKVTQFGTFALSPLAVGHTLWQAGDEVTVNSPMAMLNNYPLKIRQVTWMQDNTNGTQTLLNLVTPTALNGSPVVREPFKMSNSGVSVPLQPGQIPSNTPGTPAVPLPPGSIPGFP